MHIQEGTNTTLTTCTKMTEEVDRRHGVNGNSSVSSSKVASEDAVQANTTTPGAGGRLKFFKDGKFILELVRGWSREGERPGWVSVPRKSLWAPAASSAHTQHPPLLPRPERAASLSVSDDNSSIQSSPWQRDHCWKQTNPRRNISKELTFYYCRPSTLHNNAIEANSRVKRRRPYDATCEPIVNGARALSNGVDRRRNGDAGSPDARVDDTDGETYYHKKLKKPYQYNKARVYRKTRNASRRGKLAGVLERLRGRVPAAPINAKLVNCRAEHAMVSPRKRILRELERVSLEEASGGGKRRARAPAPAAAPAAGPSRAPTPLTKNAHGYSITSLLSRSPPPPPAPAPPPHPWWGYGARPPLLYGYGYYGAPPLWLPYAPQPHPHAPHAPPRHYAPDDAASDLPLNLSKH